MLLVHEDESQLDSNDRQVHALSLICLTKSGDGNHS